MRASFLAIALITPFLSSAFAADIAFPPAMKKAGAPHCADHFKKGRVTEDMLASMHDSGCCDVFLRMPQTEIVDILEERMHCQGWHAYKALHGYPPLEFEHLESGNPPPPSSWPTVVGGATTPAVVGTGPDVATDPPDFSEVEEATARVSIPWTVVDEIAEWPEIEISGDVATDPPEDTDERFVSPIIVDPS